MEPVLRWIAVLLGATLLAEVLSLTASRVFGNNMPVYAVFSLVQYALTISFYRLCLPLLRRYLIYWMLLGCGAVFWLCDVLLWQPLDQSNTYFMAFEGICVIIMAFLFVRRFLSASRHSKTQVALFRISLFLAFFWSATFFSWGPIDITDDVDPALKSILLDLVLVINILTYSGIGMVLMLLPKSKTAH